MADHAWAAWLIAALVLAGVEMMSLDLVLLMLAVGAAAGAVTAALGAPFVLDMAVAAIVSVAMLGAVRPSVVKRLHAGPSLTTGHAALVGRTGVVVTSVDDETGQIRLAGELWTARAYDPDMVLEPGTKVSVFEIDGATAVVYPAD